MTSPILILRTLASLAPFLVALSPVLAQDAVTAPRGIYTVKIPGATAENPVVRSYLGIQLLPDTRFRGNVVSVTGNAISFQNFNPTDLHLGGIKSYVHVLDGSGVGFITDIEEFRTSDIVCSIDPDPWIQPGTSVRIRPHPRLSDLLGASNRFGLAAHTDAGTADNVVVWDPEAQQERVYYFHSIRQRWEEREIDADAGNAIFRFPYGFYIVRRSPGTLRIALTGEIGSDTTLLPARSGANVFSLPVNLSRSLDKILRADSSFPVVSGPNASSADILTFEEPTTGAQRGPFYHQSDSSGTGWREVGVNGSTASTQPLDFLSTLILRREGGAGSVLAEGSLEPPAQPLPPLPPDPEPGELPLTGELPFPYQIPPHVVVIVEISSDLQTWTKHADVQISNGKATFDIPSGQSRAFYRLRAFLNQP